MTDERLNTGYAALETDTGDVPVQVSGVAIGEGDITQGGSGKRTLWPRDALENAPLRGSDEALAGQPIATDDNHTADGPQTHTPSEAIRGGIEWAGYKPGVGVLYEGEITDPQMARNVDSGHLEVSPLVARDIEPLEGDRAEEYRSRGYNVDDADYVVTDIHRWRDLAAVAKGAAPSNDITVGGQPMKAEALHDTVAALADITDLSSGALVRWNSSGDRDAYGEVEETITEGEFDDEIDGDVTVSAPAALITVHTPGADGWEETDQQVAHKPGTLTVIDELPDAESLAHDPALSDSVEVPDRIQNAAQAALDADDGGLIPSGCGTGTGQARARALADGSVQVNDFLTRGDDDRTPIPAYLNSHEDDASTSDPPTEWGEDEWSDCGNVGLARWGWYVDWFREKANELARHRDEDEPYESLTAEALASVAGVSFTDTADGELDESEIPNDDYESHYLYPGDTKTESSYPVVDADGNLRRGNVDAAWQLGARGGVDAEEHDSRLLALAEEFENPPEWATGDGADAMALGGGATDPGMWAACSMQVPESVVGNDDPGGASSSTSDTLESDTTMTDDTTESLSDDEQYLLRVAGDNPGASAEALEAYHDTENAMIISESEYESLTEQVETAKDLYAESLADQWGTEKDKIKSNFGLEALREEFETEDGDLDKEALVQQPQTSQPEQGDTDNGGLEALSDEQVAKAEALYADYEMMSNPPESLEDRILEVLEMSDFDEAMEVLD